MTNPLFDTLFGRHIGKPTPFLHLADGAMIDHAGFLRQSARFANAFHRLEFVPGDRVAVQIDKSPDALAIYAACVQAGLVFLPLNPAYTATEVAYFIEDSGAKLLICKGCNHVDLTPIAKINRIHLETLEQDGGGSFAALAREMPDCFAPVARLGGDLAALLYTSGTTGRSKGAMLTQDNLLSNARTLADVWRFSAHDVLLHALPIFHTHGLFVAVNVTLLAGGAMIFLPRFDLDMMIENIPRSTSLMGVPTFYTRLLSDTRFTKDLTNHMRLFISGSAPLLAETHKQLTKQTGHHILERYGMTETNMNTSNPYQGERRAGTVGFALPGVELKITDENSGETLAQGQTGMVEVRGPNVFKGYWNMPEKTAEELRIDGFFITGDLGQLDKDGYLHIIGRSKDLIISGGFNIYPKEIELILDDQPGVLESAIIGVSDADFGEAVLGVLVAAKNSTPDPVQINAALRNALAGFKQPRKLLFVPELPRNSMGKVQKNVLRQKYRDIFA